VSEIRIGPQPSHHIPEPDKRTADDWVELGKNDELDGRNLDAFETYKEALAKFPDSFAAGKAAGRLAACLLRYAEAKQFLEPEHARDTTDTEISYYLGIAYVGLGETDHARFAFEQTEILPTFYSPAALALGELLARRGDLHGAEHHLSEALRAAPDDVRTLEELTAIKNSVGESQEAQALAREGLTRFPLSFFLREEVGTPDLAHLANDSDRVLNIAAEYMRLGLYQKAVNVLSRKYPPPVSDQSEPGAVAPQDHPMIAYFRGFCREKLGQSGSEDYRMAARLSTAYIFPSTAEELAVLRAVLQTHPSDTTAHYLLGTLYFSRGLTDAALEEWSEARKAGPEPPVLSASMGLALLQIKNDPERALSAFRDGLESDPNNIAIYLGLDQTLSLLRRPARERVEVLEKYPQLDSAPPALIFELILNLAEAGDFERATQLFHGRFFPREEGGTNVRQVWIEVQLLRARALAKQGKCGEALGVARHIGSEVPGLPFTRDGLEPMLESPRANYLLGRVFASCGETAEAHAKFQLAAAASDFDQIEWAWLAARNLPGFNQAEWKNRLQASLEEAEKRSKTAPTSSWWEYTTASLAKELGQTAKADAGFRQTLLLPDRMLLYHLTRLAQSEVTQ
jgi:tetratricopeptide (TPR) repeat protein